MEKGETFMGLVIVAGCVLFVLAGVMYLKSENSDYKQLAENTNDLKISITTLEATLKKILEENKTMAETTVAMLADLNKRVSAIETQKKDDEWKHVNLQLREPLQVNVVYGAPKHEEHQAPRKTALGVFQPKENN